jgi:uncharacterized protein YjbI with pentapeptide repeats
MTEITPPCRFYVEMAGFKGFTCVNRALPGDPDGLCILHCRDKNKDWLAFKEALLDRLNPMKQDGPKTYDLSGVWFPGSFYCKDILGYDRIFEKAVDFCGATFTEKANFTNVNFKQGARFDRATFMKEAYFLYTKFIGEVGFIKTTFEDRADFTQATFSERIRFNETTFSGETFFNKVTFSKESDFSSCLIKNQLVLDRINPTSNEEPRKNFRAVLRWIRFTDQGRLVFQDLSMTHVNLIEADLRQCRFNNVGWRVIRGRKAVYDEVQLYEGENPTKENYARVEECYRYLKMNFEAAGDLKNSGDFHCGEMEMHRRASKWRWFPLYWYNLYRGLSGYGERPLRACLWLLALIPLFAGLVWGLGINPAASPDLKTFGDLLLFTFEKATFQRPEVPKNLSLLGKFLGSLSGLLIPGQAALFILALRNRLGRRR